MIELLMQSLANGQHYEYDRGCIVRAIIPSPNDILLQFQETSLSTV
jgi:hypothetical protein